MVQVRDSLHLSSANVLDSEGWINRIWGENLLRQPKKFRLAFELIQQYQLAQVAGLETGEIENFLETGTEIVQILSSLKLDEETLLAGFLYRFIRKGRLTLDEVEHHFGEKTRAQLEGVLRMAAITTYHRQLTSDQDVTEEQLINVRRMLVAIVNDVRVALIKIAERIAMLRIASQFKSDRQKRLATEVFYIYAPLAHRLGIGQLKWELEDLSFRYLNPDAYHQIASQLDEKRLDRQSYISKVKSDIIQAIDNAYIEADVVGRAKHIYSIWRKMERKQIRFDQVMDIRALRILVLSISDCYSVLGIVHGLWKAVPREFDDYIANPKINGYRSLHTAVLAEGNKVVEIQIRTYDMHEDAELGVCSHWKYKGTDSEDKSGYEEKITWLRQVLDWHEKLGNFGDLISDLHSEVESARVYVFSPKGDVIDLPMGSTPIDFAYHVHTDIGHKCKGAKINRKLVSLDTQLSTGDQVQILCSQEEKPNRDWLNLEHGYVKTLKARQKIAQWFRHQSKDTNLEQGKALLKAEFDRLGVSLSESEKWLSQLNLASMDALYEKIGSGRLRIAKVLEALESIEDKDSEPADLPELPTGRRSIPKVSDNIQVGGLSNLQTNIAKCCQPLPEDSIVGYLTRSNGVSIHRQDCSNVGHLIEENPRLALEVSWNSDDRVILLPVTLRIEAEDRKNLLLDISSVVSKENLNIISMNTRSLKDIGRAIMEVEVELPNLQKLSVLLMKINNLSGIYSARRAN